MNSLKVPYIEGLENMSYNELDMAMETGAAKAVVGTVNWPEYPYHPDVAFAVARSATHICILYHVRCLDLRAVALEDGGRVWEDSCCEFFVSHPSDGTYYNFEMNCIGTLLVAKRTGRHDPAPLSPEQMQRVIRHTTLHRRTVDLSGKIFGWSVAMCIPFDLIGVDANALPASLRANFFKCGDKTAHPHFLSWNPIDVPQPDFHRPEFFGELVM